MIGIRIIGGLGNQLFQYSTIKSLSEKINKEFKLDIRGFKKYPRNVFLLDRFNISGQLANEQDYRNYNWILRRPCKLLQKFGIYKKWYQEKSYYYDKNVNKVKDNIFLYGYYQSFKYFSDIKDTLRKEFTLKKNLNQSNSHIRELIEKNNSVMIHIRRDDYLTNSKINNDFGVCSLDYYKKAISFISEKVNTPYFIIFSDDFEWTKNNLHLNFPHTYVEGNYFEPEIDFFLMSKCKHHIIANSTLSWWGAWLSENEKKIIIRPKNWFKNLKLSTHDLIPDDWIKI